MGKLPELWTWAGIGEVAKLNFRDPAISDLPDDLLVTFVPMAAVDANKGVIAKPEVKRLGLVRKGFMTFSEGDILFAKITPSMENGKIAIASNLLNGIGFGSTEFHIISPEKGILAEWLFYFTRQEKFRRDAVSSFAGTAGQLRVPANFLKDYQLPIAPLAEQKCIVYKVGELFDRIESGIEALQKAKTQLRRYRQSVLNAAVDGRLTEKWRDVHSDTEPAETLLERVSVCKNKINEGKDFTQLRLQSLDESEQLSVNDKSVLPKGWVWVTIEQLTSKITSGSRGWSQFYADSGAIFIRAQDIKSDKLELDDVAHVKIPSNIEGIRTLVKFGDILIVITGANITRSALVESEIGEAYVSQHVALLRPAMADLMSYLYTYIIAPKYGRYYLRMQAYGAGKPGLNLDSIRKLVVRLPPIAEQKEIIKELERFMSSTENIEARIDACHEYSKSLCQSILKDAFLGKLVPQNHDDVPASKLLEEIKNIKLKSNKPRKITRIRSDKKPKERQNIYDVLKEEPSLTPEELFFKSGFNIEEITDIDKFFEELRTEVTIKSRIEDVHKNGFKVYLKVIKNED